jgi:hypothetical protein
MDNLLTDTNGEDYSGMPYGKAKAIITNFWVVEMIMYPMLLCKKTTSL